MSNTENSDKEDDPSYKRLFSAPEVVRDLIMGFIDDAWLHSLDFSTQEKQPSSYVTDDYRHRHDNVVWRLKADGERPWHAATNIADLIAVVPGLVLKHLPSLEYLLIAEKDFQNQDLKSLKNLKELKMGLAERIETWEREFLEQGRQEGIQTGIQTGIQKGKQEGESLILQRQLAKRFGPLPADKIAIIAVATTDQLEVWLDRVLDAETLESVFS